jgi:uncharacterized repeat protein (TIGR01451 family)
MMNDTRHQRQRRRHGCAIAAAACLWPWFAVTSHAATTLTIEPAEPEVSSCLGFGAGPGAGTEGADAGAVGFDPTSPFMGLVYKNIPAFDLKQGDVLAFDLGAVNDFDVELDIALAATTSNGGENQAEPFTRVVSNAQTPANPRGDTVIGNFELQFVVENAYSFAGGGLIMRFSNGSAAYRADTQTCDQVGVVGKASDSSGFFVRAFWNDPNGESPWPQDENPLPLREDIINGFRVVSTDVISVTAEFLDAGGATIAGALPGDVVTYRVTAQNGTQTDATGVVVTATLADGFTFLAADATPAAATVHGGGPPATVTWTIGALAAGAAASLDVDLEVQLDANGQPLSNNAGATAVDAPFELSIAAQTPLDIGDVLQTALDTSGNSMSLITIAYLYFLILFLRRRAR